MGVSLARPGAAIAVTISIIKAIEKREDYCGKNPENCLRCGEESCEKYDLELVV